MKIDNSPTEKPLTLLRAFKVLLRDLEL